MPQPETHLPGTGSEQDVICRSRAENKRRHTLQTARELERVKGIEPSS